jgi:hypothetical protein
MLIKNSKMFGGVLSRMFAVKSFLFLYPLQTVFFFSLSVTIIISYIVRIFENSYRVEPDGSLVFISNFGNISDAFWYLWVTYSTVGYGDYFPKTILGRIVGLMAAMLGTFVTSTLIVSLQQRLTLRPIEVQV